MLRWIDNLLDRITMYRLVLYYLIVIILTAVGLSVANVLPYNPAMIVATSLYLVAGCWVTEWVFSHVFEVPYNIESSIITALILALLINPAANSHTFLFLTAAGGLAIASKYILNWRGKHIFNPAAIAVALTAIGPEQSASWWVGNTALLPVVAIGGLLIVRKIRRVQMAAVFFITAIAATAWVSFLAHGDPTSSLDKVVLHSSLFFLGFVMLTEPLTAPVTHNKQLWYAALVGLLFPPQVHFGTLYSTPELALIAGNIYAFIVSPRVKLLPRLVQKLTTGPMSGDFVFAMDKPFAYQPGQYMEWTIAHPWPDSRGNRRSFTLASSPTEDNLRLGVKFYPKGSTFKEAMLTIDEKTRVSAGQVAGDFVMPKDTSKKLAFIAGGIGVTPFRSMIKYLVDIQQQRDVVLLYSEKQPDAFVYRDVFDIAGIAGFARPIYTITDPAQVPSDWQGQTGIVSAEMIASQIPDYKDRIFYISGPHGMVVATKDILKGIGVPSRHIKTDHFSGYA